MSSSQTARKAHIAIIDYGYGNLHSAENAFRKIITDTALPMDVSITDDPDVVANADKVVLPGQGAFGACMNALAGHADLLDALTETVLHKGRPFLGICVGMQLLASRGHEYGLTDGLNWISGDVVPLRPADTSLKIPHMGWNTLDFDAPGMQDNRHPVLKSVRPESHFYFVHSFMFECKNTVNSLAQCDYGGPLTAVVGADNYIGVQFHPEKSHESGLRLLEDFLHWMP